MHKRYTLEKSAIYCDGRKLLSLVRSIWGDGAPSHHELEEAERDVGAVLAAANDLRKLAEAVAAIRPVRASPGVPATMWNGSDVAAAVAFAQRLLEDSADA